MTIEVVTNNSVFIELEGVKKIHFLENEGYYFIDNDGKTLMHVPVTNLAYYKQV